MDSLNGYVREYTAQLRKGQIQKAYKGIMTFLSDLKVYLESAGPDYASSALYFGYMDMSYFAFTPPELKDKKLKIAIVYLHEECRFELWLAANNRKVQADYIELLKNKDIGGYTLTKAGPGVDSIIETIIARQPDFDNAELLKRQIEAMTREFTENVISIFNS
jgi:hypothetical protein